MVDSAFATDEFVREPARRLAARAGLGAPARRQYARSLWPRCRPVPELPRRPHRRTGDAGNAQGAARRRYPRLHGAAPQREPRLALAGAGAVGAQELLPLSRTRRRGGHRGAQRHPHAQAAQIPAQGADGDRGAQNHLQHRRNGRAPLGRGARHGGAVAVLRRRPAYFRSAGADRGRPRKPGPAGHRQGRQGPAGAADRGGAQEPSTSISSSARSSHGRRSRCSAGSRAGCCRRG